MAALVGVMAGSMLAPSAGSTSLSYLGESSLAGMSVALEAYAEKSGADDTNVLADMGIVTEEKTAEATTVAEKHVAGLSLDEVEAYAETSAPAAETAQAAEAEKEEPATIAASMLVASAGIAGETEKSAEAASAETESAAPAAGESTPAIQAAESATTAAAESQEIQTSAAETAEETDAAVATAEVKEPSKYTNLGISIAPNYVNIRQEPNTDSEVVGKLYNGAAATICGTEGEWVLIESGHCQGYIKSEFLAIGADAEAVASDYGETVAKVTADGLRVRDDKSTEAAVLAVVSTDERYEVISESDEWVKIRVDDSTKGWVYKQFVDIDVIFEKGITIEEEQEKIRKEKEAEERRKAEEEARRKAEAEAAAKKKAEEEAKKKAEAEAAKKKSDSSKKKEDTSSKKKEDTSSKKKEDTSSKKKEEDSSSKKKEEEKKSDEGGDGGSYDASTGAKVVAYAKQFVGNPYVYGGTSLTNGCDCSGFTMKVMEHFGISLPRSSYDQQFSGTSVSLNNLQPGDLILYAKNGRVNHVTIYIGGGQVVHASQPSVGIIISNMYYRTPYCARRVIH
ncbi:MAG: C40 family peptidase [Lachnospiraceae bacterium]|nr:C40 family peptidase [Lachnospiraceae bacterium]